MTTIQQRLRAVLRRTPDPVDEILSGPIHGDLLGAEHLAERARAVARGQVLTPSRRFDPRARLPARLDSTRRILDSAYIRISRHGADGGEIDPSGEWLLDNYHLIQDHMQEAREALPRRFYRELPELASGVLRGYPRVYELAIALISHSEGRVDLDNVDLFVEAYQEVTPLVIGELWALPAMLRLGLIENIRRMTLRTLDRLDELALADRWVERILAVSSEGGPGVALALSEVTAFREHHTSVFLSRLLGQLRLASGASPALVWLERWMQDDGRRPEDAAAQATQRVAHTQIMMANSITSLRSIGRRDWRQFVERQSAMEAVLRRDPTGDYPRMSFGTRDRYRHAVERIARRSGRGEVVVAELAIRMAVESSTGSTAAMRRRHVGYFLIDDGLPALERAAGSVPVLPERILRWFRDHPDTVLVGGLITFTVLALIVVGLLAEVGGTLIAWPIVLLFTFLPAWDIGISAINQVVTAVLPPRVLPRINVGDDGIPAELATAVVVPTLFATLADVETALQDLEVLFLANREGGLHFAILSDFTDAEREVMPDDAALLDASASGVRELNARYSEDAGEVFHLLHRPRRWNAGEGCWMGWERKRGKLAEFNRLVRGGGRAAFHRIVGDTEGLESLRYVITLDADTMLPQGAAAELIGTMAHPLNRAVYDADQGRIVAGYGILQPRVGVSLASAGRSRFATIHAGLPGVDPYTTAVSDVYQDLYGEGSFTGKGIYDVEAFAEATHGRFPENTLLSHDLIEGNFVRAGLATGIIVYDEYPATYLAHARRKHRWIRGDWQLLPWLGPRVPGPAGREPNRLPLLSRWKILDNLRRSTVELAQLALFVAGWGLLPGEPIRWILLGLGAIGAPWAISLLLHGIRPPTDRSWRAYYQALAADARNSLRQFGLAVAFLPHQAWLSADAILRTLIRVTITRRHLLQWQSAAQVERVTVNSTRATWRAMAPALVLVTGLAVTMTAVAAWRAGVVGPPAERLWPYLVAIWPITTVWLLAPFLAVWLGRSPAPETLDASGQRRAREYADRHWRYFDQFVTAETHWLVPDNVQADPGEVIAMRTSPTNIGLQLLATVSANDLGLIALGDMTDRLDRTMATLQTLPRFRGHFYNWYGIDDLRVLEPGYISTVDSGNLAGHLLAFRQACLELAACPDDEADGVVPRDRLCLLADQAESLVREMDFHFLLDRNSKLFTIGYHPDTNSCDSASYDLLASEARLASFVAIALGQAPVESWFRLGRGLVRRDGVPMMVSWSGSMFEYLMPLLVMKSFPGTLLDQSDRGAIRRQVAYGHERGVPWGVSESAYNLRDQQLTYQYRAFGVPELALRRGMGRDLVVAPYASALAAMLVPNSAMTNLARLEAKNALGPHGFWDALDFTRHPPGARFAMVRTVMAHHAGMTIVAFTNLLCGDLWSRRFHRDPRVRAAELLLQERVPRRLRVQDAPGPRPELPETGVASEPEVVRRIDSTETPQPRVALLGDLPYTVMVTHAGGGFSRYNELAVTRWQADGTADDTGQFCYIRDVTAGRTWSAGFQPTGAEADEYHAHFAPDRVALHRVDGPVETRTEIVVVPADAAEVRRITLTNHSSGVREFELTSYAEVVMGPADTDALHPAFAALFVETEWHAWCSAITARRRPRRADESAPWCVHVVDSGPATIGRVSCETSRERFIGRGRTIRCPQAMEREGPQADTVGAVLDPIVSLRTRVRVASGESVTVAFTTLVADSRLRAFELADRYRDPHASQRALDLAWMATQIDLRDWAIGSRQAATFQEIAGHLLYGRDALRPPDDELRRNHGDQQRLWAHGISGDLPILLAVIDGMKGLATLRELFEAHRFWRRHGLRVDLVVVISHPHDYLQEVRQAIEAEMHAASDASSIDQPGGVFLRRRDTFEAADFLMLSATARVHVPCDGRPLDRIVPPVVVRADHEVEESLVPHYIERRVRPRPPAPAPPPPPVAADQEIAAGNGHGALTRAGNYRIHVAGDQVPPAPWVNVIANPHGGFLVSERGAGCTWADSAYFYRLTPWHNDPVTDPACDVIYLHDDASGDLWSATPAPVRGPEAYDVEHAPGRSTFHHRHGDIATTLTVGLPVDAAIKCSVLTVTNHGQERRTLSLTAYAEWTLGVRREVSWPQVRTEYVGASRAILARNRFDPSFREHVAFLAITEPVRSYTADRREFVGRHGTLADPAALRRNALGGRIGAGLDPCAALQVALVLEPGEQREVAVLLGAAIGEEAAIEAMARFDSAAEVGRAIEANCEAWEQRLSVITVRTPDPEFDAVMNRWMLYQALSSRMWARMGLYQSSGAYGFRDQLQDCMAFVYAEPSVAREHLLRAASRQFLEGDVQHWWHPHTGRGVRTRFSDDLAWLPHVVDHYVLTSGDERVLDERVPFLRMRELQPGEHEIYDLPTVTDEDGSVYEHCVRALRRACTRGGHGLPLIGTGDWNDGFSRVGIEGRGESIWLAWFLIRTCRDFAVHANQRGDTERQR